MPGPTVFTYNGITMKPVKTVSIEEKPVFSDDGIDYLYTSVTIRINLLYNPTQTAYGLAGGVPIAAPGTVPSLTEATIRHFLMQPRKQLVFSNYSNNIISSPSGLSGTDANNGPVPLSCSVMRVDGGTTFHVQYAIQTWIIECPINIVPGNPIISNRYSQSVSYDGNHYATQVSQGRAYFRADTLYNSNVADYFRDSLLPNPPAGFKREKITVNVSTNGIIVDWMTEDKELAYDLGETDARQGGSGITKIDAKYGVQSLATDGVMSPMALAQCQVNVWGNKYSNNWTMMQAAMQLASERLPIGDPNTGGFLRHVSLQESLTDRHIELIVVYQLPVDNPFKPGAGPAPISQFRKGNPFANQNGAQPGFPNDAGSRGTAQNLILSAQIHASCTNVGSPQCPPGSPGGGIVGVNCGPPPAVQVNFIEVLPDVNPNYSITQSSPTPYTRTRIKRNIKKKEGKVHLPVALPPLPNHPLDMPKLTPPRFDSQKRSSVISLHAPLTQVEIEWESERINDIPLIPNPDIGDCNLTLLSSIIIPMAIVALPDGSAVAYYVKGLYTYAAYDDIGAGDNLTFDALPWMAYQYGDPTIPTQINQGYYAHGMIDPLGSMPCDPDPEFSGSPGNSPGNSGGNS